ncbi:MAG: hypothetical protein CW338_02670 [Clostridiales bacterium]|nr:hypothetical protein [Clostridiales bacterium]
MKKNVRNWLVFVGVLILILIALAGADDLNPNKDTEYMSNSVSPVVAVEDDETADAVGAAVDQNVDDEEIPGSAAEAEESILPGDDETDGGQNEPERDAAYAAPAVTVYIAKTTEVFERADKESSVVAVLPKGIEVELRLDMGGWKHVVLSDGREGYICIIDEEATDAAGEASEEAPAGEFAEETMDKAPAEESGDGITVEVTAEESAEDVIVEYPASDPAEEIIEVMPSEEPVEEIIEEIPAEEPAEEIVEEMPAEEPAEEIVEEMPVEESVEEIVEEISAEEPAEEIVEEIPAEEPVEEIVVEETPAEEPVEEIVAEETPAEEPAEEIAEEIPAEEPVEEIVVEETPAEEPVEETVEEIPAEETFAGEFAEEDIVLEEIPAEDDTEEDAEGVSAEEVPAEDDAEEEMPDERHFTFLFDENGALVLDENGLPVLDVEDGYSVVVNYVKDETGNLVLDEAGYPVMIDYIELKVSIKLIILDEAGILTYGAHVRLQAVVENAPEDVELNYAWYCSANWDNPLPADGDHYDVVVNHENALYEWKVDVWF